MLGLGPISPVTTVTPSTDKSIEIISSICLLKNYYVFVSGSITIPTAAA